MARRNGDNTPSIPLHRVAVVRPFAQFLAEVGAPVAREFQRAGLPFQALENVDNYVPSHRFWALLVNASRSQGIDDLGFHVGHNYGADSPDPKMTNLLRQSPTLYQGLLKASDLTNNTISNCRIGLIQPPRSKHSYFYHRPSCDADNPAIDQISGFGLPILIDMVRVFAGPQWHPPEVGVMANRTPRSIREFFPDTRMRPSQQYSYIAVDNALLSRPPFIHGATKPGSSPLHYHPVTQDLVGSLKQALLSYAQDGDLSIDLAAELCDMSKRTLQRKLAETDTCYSEVLSHTRFHAARRMLQNLDMKVTDVAHLLGYAHATHFSRAFRRIAGMSPRAYRQASSTFVGSL